MKALWFFSRGFSGFAYNSCRNLIYVRFRRGLLFARFLLCFLFRHAAIVPQLGEDAIGVDFKRTHYPLFRDGGGLYVCCYGRRSSGRGNSELPAIRPKKNREATTAYVKCTSNSASQY